MYAPVVTRPDFIVTSSAGRPRLLVEVRHFFDLKTYGQPNEAGWLPTLPEGFLLLVTPHQMLLWAPPTGGAPPRATSEAPFTPSSQLALGEPAYVESSPLILAPYLDVERYPLTSLGEQRLGLIVFSWLGSVMFKPADYLRQQPAQAWLVESGLHEAIYRGYIQEQRSEG